MSRDPRVDAYIARQQDFAKPVLRYIRDNIGQEFYTVDERSRSALVPARRTPMPAKRVE